MSQEIKESSALEALSREAIQQAYDNHVASTYARFPIAFSHGRGSYLWDTSGRQYLDMGGGIAVSSLGHGHPELVEALSQQARRFFHVSNLYYQAPQARLAGELCALLGPGKVFFCNSGAEANEGLYKLARKFGHEEGRFEIITARQSFHGRTLAGLAATGQTKIRHGFEPIPEGFRQVPFNDLESLEEAISPATVAVLIEGIQGESGVHPVSANYLIGLRQLCDRKGLLLMWDGVQCGHFRTGAFQSFDRILEGHASKASFFPDAVSMAKSLGGGLPIGAFWTRAPHDGVLGPGSHGATYGGGPIVCAGALKILEIIQRDQLARNARQLGEHIKSRLLELTGQYPGLMTDVRGLGLMIGMELANDIPAFRDQSRVPSLQFIDRLHKVGLLAIPAGAQVVRFLPPLNLSPSEADEGLHLLESVLKQLS